MVLAALWVSAHARREHVRGVSSLLGFDKDRHV